MWTGLSEFAGVTHHPWMGHRYSQSCFGVRLLILGEAFISENPEACNRRDLASEIVTDYGQMYPNRFYTKVANVLLQREEGGSRHYQHAAMWEHVSFYNYVQTVLPKARMSPTEDQWCQAEAPFKTVLECIQPDAVLILGIGRLNGHVTHRPQETEFGAIKAPNGSGFEYPGAIATFRKLLRAAGGQLNL